MKTKDFLIFSLLFVPISLSGIQHSFTSKVHEFTFSPVRGDTDGYGYYWMDSNEPGGPIYNWIDITGTGTKVEGLTDDNNVGPFILGFDFPYYWYYVDHFFVNANGAISFSDPTVYTPQGSSGFLIPGFNDPNDLLIPLGADLTFENGDPAECYYYTNNIDTFIVSYIDVPAWNTGPGPTGAHTFQLILTRQDSCIYFQYGNQEGQFYNNADCAGIEDNGGTIGLQVFFCAMPDSGYAVKFIPPDTAYHNQFLDIGISDVINYGSKCVFLLPGVPFQLTATIKNYGNVDAGIFGVNCTVFDTSYSIYYTDTVTVNGLSSDAETTVYFTPSWTPPSYDNYFALCQTQLAGDTNPSNDSKDIELRAISLPGWSLMYDSDPQQGIPAWWSVAGGGWAQEFTPPFYPMQIESVLITLKSPHNCLVPILFMDDDGFNGFPGTILFLDTIFVPGSSGFNYYKIQIPYQVGTITSGKFYVGFIQTGDSFPQMITEDKGPFSRCAWEFTGAWCPYRDKESTELLIRAHGLSPGVNENIESRASRVISLFPAKPNPANNHSLIHFVMPNDALVTLKVYDIAGRNIMTLINEHKKAGLHSVTLNTKDLPQGIYLYRLSAGLQSITRKILVIH